MNDLRTLLFQQSVGKGALATSADIIMHDWLSTSTTTTVGLTVKWKIRSLPQTCAISRVQSRSKKIIKIELLKCHFTSKKRHHLQIPCLHGLYRVVSSTRSSAGPVKAAVMKAD